MLQCPKCESADIRYSRVKWVWESWRKLFTTTSPYRCGKCGWRWWAPDAPDDHAIAASPPRLWDAFMAAAPARFDELDLESLNIPRKHARRESY